MNVTFRTEPITFAYSEWSLEAAIAQTKSLVPGLEIEDAETIGGGGWPEVRLIGTVPVLVEALKQWATGDAEEDLEILRTYLADLEVVRIEL